MTSPSPTARAYAAMIGANVALAFGPGLAAEYGLTMTATKGSWSEGEALSVEKNPRRAAGTGRRGGGAA